MTQCFMVESVMDCWNPGGGERVGAMCWRSHEYEPHDTTRRPMPHLGVMTQAGLICLDCPESDSSAMWERTGEPPTITVTPSINVSDGAWHGWLMEGVLTP